jgi:hypothetical protein
VLFRKAQFFLCAFAKFIDSSFGVNNRLSARVCFGLKSLSMYVSLDKIFLNYLSLFDFEQYAHVQQIFDFIQIFRSNF